MCPIPKELRDFVVDDGMCNCWGDANYEPSEELEHLISEREREELEDKESELEDFEIQRPRRAKSFRQRLAEKKMRAKRLAMTKEANCWYMNQKLSQTQAPPAWSYSSTSATRKKMAAPPKISPPQFKPATSSRQKTEAIQTKCQDAFPQYESDSSENPSSSSKGFKTPTKSKGADMMSARSVMSPVARQRILDALEWDS